jgi:hypothetical protein
MDKRDMRYEIRDKRIGFKLILVLSLISYLVLPITIFARVNPESIYNDARETYEKKRQTYSLENQKKLDQFEEEIKGLNAFITGELENNTLVQGEILDEYIRRKDIPTVPETDGIRRNLTDPVENARYWITYAHEAIAFQAAKNYLFSLGSESTVDRDIVLQINSMQADIGVLKGKVEKSKQALLSLLTKKS